MRFVALAEQGALTHRVLQKRLPRSVRALLRCLPTLELTPYAQQFRLVFCTGRLPLCETGKSAGMSKATSSENFGPEATRFLFPCSASLLHPSSWEQREACALGFLAVVLDPVHLKTSKCCTCCIVGMVSRYVIV